ncbi:restriction endonuclease [uncultured Streptomyces sp.]|uniref:restriction endonuclease n=1 Tax=uncultured Streptomyces sp. TaxID=174707 RepID=UPI00261047DA|nr:restriction endonuclease [uncultured Streptomyces sp.]
MTGARPNDGTPATCPSTRTVLHDPDGLLEAGLQPDRGPHECLVTAVLAWTGPDTLAIRDYHQIALQLTAHARALATELHHRTGRLPKDSGPKALAEVVLDETDAQLRLLPEGTMRCAQNRARTVRALYERLDRLAGPRPTSGSRAQET